MFSGSASHCFSLPPPLNSPKSSLGASGVEVCGGVTFTSKLLSKQAPLA